MALTEGRRLRAMFARVLYPARAHLRDLALRTSCSPLPEGEGRNESSASDIAVRTLKQGLRALALAISFGASGCVYSGGGPDPIEHPGPPLGITALRVPWEKFVIPPPPPGGFSKTYQKQVFERQRLARLQAEREAQARSGSAVQPQDPSPKS